MITLTQTLNVPETIEEFRENSTFKYCYRNLESEHNNQVCKNRIDKKYADSEEKKQTCLKVHNFYLECAAIINALYNMPLYEFGTLINSCIRHIKPESYCKCCDDMYSWLEKHSNWIIYVGTLQCFPNETDDYEKCVDACKKYGI